MFTYVTCTCLSKSLIKEEIFQCFLPRVLMTLDLASHSGTQDYLTPSLLPYPPLPRKQVEKKLDESKLETLPVMAGETGRLLESPKARA